MQPPLLQLYSIDLKGNLKELFAVIAFRFLDLLKAKGPKTIHAQSVCYYEHWVPHEHYLLKLEQFWLFHVTEFTFSLSPLTGLKWADLVWKEVMSHSSIH